GAPGLAAIATDPLLLHVLQSTTIRDVDLEHVLTCARRELLVAANTTHRAKDDELRFCCALARQCFINEYVFATTEQEEQDLEIVKRGLVEALNRDAPIPALWLAVIATYLPLSTLSHASVLLDRAWPETLSRVTEQQLHEPWEEREIRDSIPRLT